MKLLVVNPNTTARMTALIGEQARAVAGGDVRVHAVNPPSGPPSIECHADEVAAAPGVLAEITAAEAAGFDAYVIACFGDPGLLAAREIARGPVVGIAEAAMRTAGYLGRRFSVVTTLERTTGHAWDIARQYGVADLCAGMHACDLPVLALDTDSAALDRVRAACTAALAADGSDVIVLGCAGMAGFGARLADELGVPVVDGVTAAVVTAEALVRLGLRTSKRGEFAPPPAKDMVG
jgi:allantoin racemase